MNHYKQLEFQDVIDELRSNYLVSLGTGIVLYKGIAFKDNLHKYYVVDPKLFTRESKTKVEHGNAYNLLLNNLPSWSKIPRRQYSVITSSNISTARNFSVPIPSKGQKYGKTYCVIPTIDSILAIAPSRDIWSSFSPGLSKIGLRGKDGTLIKFNCILNGLYRSTRSKNEFDSTWEVFNENIKSIAFNILKPKVRLSDEEMRMLEYLKRNKKDLIGFFDDVFKPALNNIIILNYNRYLDIKNFENNEIWTESKCLLLEEDSLNEVKKKFNKA